MSFDSLFQAMGEMKEREFTFKEFKEVYVLADEMAYLVVHEMEEKGIDHFLDRIHSE